jgi:hypothetical protein
MVYGHTSQGILELVREIKRLESLEGRTLSLAVGEPENGWPLPWYRRQALGSNRYGSGLPDLSAPPDIVAVSTDHFPDAAQALFSTHLCKNYELRPGVSLHVFFRRSLAGLQEPTSPVMKSSEN